jgi:hypothetical protein
MAPGSPPADGSKAAEFKLERYKYILQQLHALNENGHKYLTLFQTLATAILGGIAAVFVSWKELKITAEAAQTAIHGLLWLLAVLAGFVVVSVLGGIFSWWDYRKEEVELLDDEVFVGFRTNPKATNLWRWYETYLLIFLVLVVIGIWWFVCSRVLPLVK